MKLAPESHARIERFLREHFRDENLRLPPMVIYGSFFSRCLTRLFHIGAITFGHRILVAPALVKHEKENNRKTVPGWLIAHEAVHVLQYERDGVIRFLVIYLRGYWKGLRGARPRWNAAARMAAYLNIAEECAAREAEDAYQMWSK